MNRTKDTYDIQVYDFIKDILISCPKCKEKAFVNNNGIYLQKLNESDVKLVCVHCGYNKVLEKETNSNNTVLYTIFIGGGNDPYFNQPLWLTQSFKDHTFWAYNYAHLDFLEKHVQSTLRERNNQATRNNSLGSRLPKWISSKKNRDDILKLIKQLRDK